MKVANELREVNQQIADAQQQLNELKARKTELEGMEPAHYLANVLHSRMCHFNHTDQCSWHYEMKNGRHEWDKYAHAEYLKKAQHIISFCDRCDISENEALAIISIATDGK